MQPSKIMNALKAATQAQIPVMIWGPPGAGKSDIVRAFAESEGRDVQDIRLSQLDPVDMRGVPSVENGFTIWNMPGFLPHDPDSRTIIFVDEINSAHQSVQAAAYQLVLDRKLGEYVVPDNVVIIAAGNRATDRAIVNKMATPLANRFTHIDFDLNLDDWVKWALQNNIKEEVVSFLRFRPELLHDFDPKSDKPAFASPRTWAYASKVLETAPAEVEYEMLKGTVGEAPAGEFVAFIRVYRDLPDIEEIIKKPNEAPVPEEPASLYAVTGMLASNLSHDNIKEIHTYLHRLPTEFQVPTIKMAVTNDVSLLETKEVISWVSQHQEILL
jgi:MoxR-like ATPase